MDIDASQEEGRPVVRAILECFIAGSTAEAIIVMNTAGEICGWSRGSEELLGYSDDEVMGKSLAQIFTASDQQKNIHVYELEVARADGYAEDDRWHVRKDGSKVWVTGTLSAARNRNDEIIGFVKIMRDRTDLRTKLERIDAENQSLAEHSSRTDLFLHTLGHELRNPMGSLTMATKLLEATSDSPRAAQAVQVISRQVAVLKGLADDLMDITRGERSGFELNIERVHLQKLLLDAVGDLREAVLAKNIHLVTLLQDGPIHVDADARRLLQVILNLLGNSLKYTQPGGRIYLKAVEEVNEVVIRIEDNGIGISTEMLPKIFEFFTQDADAKKVAPGGLGVGLALVRQIVEAHHGTAAARSPGVGKGSEFTVRLPLKRA